MIRRLARWLLPALALLAPAAFAETAPAAGDPVELHFFWSRTCPHCQAARPFVEALPAHLPWLVLHSHDVTADRAAAERYVAMAEALGQQAGSVPAFFYCGRMETGFDTAETTGRELEAALIQCHEGTLPAPAAAPAAPVELPFLGRVAPADLSLPLITLVIAGLDAFNPCAFFVLLFLLSLLVHARSRGRMLFIGGVFLFFSGLIYFLFMAAWLNVFRWLGQVALVTGVAGVVAVLVGAINVKDYFRFKQGISLSIPEAAKPGLFQRMRGLLRADSLPALTLGTVALAVAANSYELLCTAGFPMIYTRVLTLADLPPAGHYAYLLLYNVIYVLPLLAITLVFTWTLGGRKLTETEGRLLKLVSGLMMLGLGLLLVAAPAALNELWTAVALLAGAVGLSWLIHRLRP